MDCRVVVEAAVPVYDVSTADEAVRIAISKTGEMLNPDLNYVEINMGERVCPHCHEHLDPAFIAADESLVALELEMKVFNVEREEHASRIARKEIGGKLENIPLEVLSVAVIEDEGEDDEASASEEQSSSDDASSNDEMTDGNASSSEEMTDGDASSNGETGDDDASSSGETGDDDASSSGEPSTATGEQSVVDDVSTDLADAGSTTAGGDDADEEDVLPEFEDLID